MIELNKKTPGENDKGCNCKICDCFKQNAKVITISVVLSVAISGLISCFALGGVGGAGGETVAKWVSENPRAIIDSVNKYAEEEGRRNQQEQATRSQDAIKKNKKALFDNPADPVVNKKGNVTIVEFFDYNCGYCHMVNGTLKELVSKNKDAKILHKHLPILSEASNTAAKYAIAVYMTQPAKYLEFHNALFEERNKTDAGLVALAKKVGVNTENLNKTLRNKKDDIEKILRDNQSLAIEIGVQGTPAFVIGDTFLPGAVDLGTLEDAVKDAKK